MATALNQFKRNHYDNHDAAAYYDKYSSMRTEHNKNVEKLILADKSLLINN